MIIPKMPEGYYLMQDTGSWYVLKDEGIGLHRLCGETGDELYFDGTTQSLAKAAEYAQKHKDAGLSYLQQVGWAWAKK